MMPQNFVYQSIFWWNCRYKCVVTKLLLFTILGFVSDLSRHFVNTSKYSGIPLFTILFNVFPTFVTKLQIFCTKKVRVGERQRRPGHSVAVMAAALATIANGREAAVDLCRSPCRLSVITFAGYCSSFSNYLHKGLKKSPKSLVFQQKITIFTYMLNCQFPCFFLV